MAITAATTLSGFSGFLDPIRSGPIFQRTAELSAVQRLGRQVPLGLGGTTVPVVTGRPSVGWVDEGGQKPATQGAMSLKTISPKKAAAIMVVSAEVARANPGGFLTAMREEAAGAFAVAFDLAALHDQGPDGTAGGGPFATYLDQSTKTQELGASSQANGGVFKDLTLALAKVVQAVDASGRRYRATGWAIDSVLEPVFWGAVDTTGRPIWTDLPANIAETAPVGSGTLLRRPAFIGEGVATYDAQDVVGYVGDWTQVAWGQIGGISYDVSTQATVTINGTLTSLWEHNLVAVRMETEFGFVVADPEAFVKITNSDNSPITSS